MESVGETQKIQIYVDFDHGCDKGCRGAVAEIYVQNGHVVGPKEVENLFLLSPKAKVKFGTNQLWIIDDGNANGILVGRYIYSEKTIVY